MPKKTASSGKKSFASKKSTAQKRATARIAERRGSGGQVRMTASAKKVSQERVPGETPLTGEDRPTQTRGGKKQQGKTTGVYEARPSVTRKGKAGVRGRGGK